MRRPTITLLTVFLVASGAPLHAQRGVIPLDSAAVASLAPLGPRIDRAARLRFATPWGSSVLADPLLLPSGLGYRSLTGPGPHLGSAAFDLQVRGRATLTGIQVGALVLGLGGALFGWEYAGIACLDSQGCEPPRLAGAALIGVIAAAAGALLGGAIGSQIPQWRTIYRYPAPTPD